MSECITFEILRQALYEASTKYDFEKIESAYKYAELLHEGQFRKSGEPYICHPLNVARIVVELELDSDSVCAALLHDTLEDCNEKTSEEEIKKRFDRQFLIWLTV